MHLNSYNSVPCPPVTGTDQVVTAKLLGVTFSHNIKSEEYVGIVAQSVTTVMELLVYVP